LRYLHAQSSEEGLEQLSIRSTLSASMRSIIKSQQHEGWKLIAGTTTMAVSPAVTRTAALKQLMADIHGQGLGHYCFTRLTADPLLADFAKLVEQFDSSVSASFLSRSSSIPRLDGPTHAQRPALIRAI